MTNAILVALGFLGLLGLGYAMGAIVSSRMRRTSREDEARDSLRDAQEHIREMTERAQALAHNGEDIQRRMDRLETLLEVTHYGEGRRDERDPPEQER